MDLVGAGADQAAEGTQFLDLDGNDNAEDTQTQLSQDIHTVPAHVYRVSFWLAGNPNGDPPVKTMTASFDGTTRDFSFDASASTTGQLNWTEETFTVTGCGSTTRLAFRSTTPGVRGPLIDAVAVVDTGTVASCGSPTGSQSGSPTGSPTASPTHSVSLGSSTTTGSAGRLPKTGGPSALMLLVAGALIVAGFGLCVLARRPRVPAGRHR